MNPAVVFAASMNFQRSQEKSEPKPKFVYDSIEELLTKFPKDSKGTDAYLVSNCVSIPKVYISGNDQVLFEFSPNLRKELGDSDDALIEGAFALLGLRIHLT